MDIKDLLAFIQQESGKLESAFPILKDRNKRILAQTCKITEEVGELSDAVLHYLGYQRKAKIASEIGGEIADVLITTLVLAHVLEIPVEDILEKKIAKIKTREHWSGTEK